MIFTVPVQYAIRAMVYLSDQEPGRLCSIQEISLAADVPRPYLAKIINRLVCGRLVRSKRGPSGGVMLAKPPSVITIRAIMESMDGEREKRRCLLGSYECTDVSACPVHETWKSVRPILDQTLHEQTLAGLAHRQRSKVPHAAGE